VLVLLVVAAAAAVGAVALEALGLQQIMEALLALPEV
jgi:hypothetical protein